MTTTLLTPTLIEDPTRLQLALQFAVRGSFPPLVDEEIYTDGDHVYGSVLDDSALVLWRLTPRCQDFGDLHFVSLPASELAERTTLDLVTEALACGAWEQ